MGITYTIVKKGMRKVNSGHNISTVRPVTMVKGIGGYILVSIKSTSALGGKECKAKKYINNKGGYFKKASKKGV